MVEKLPSLRSGESVCVCVCVADHDTISLCYNCLCFKILTIVISFFDVSRCDTRQHPSSPRCSWSASGSVYPSDVTRGGVWTRNRRAEGQLASRGASVRFPNAELFQKLKINKSANQVDSAVSLGFRWRWRAPQPFLPVPPVPATAGFTCVRRADPLLAEGTFHSPRELPGKRFHYSHLTVKKIDSKER